MTFMVNREGHPLLRVKDKIISLNSLEVVNDSKCFRLKPGNTNKVAVPNGFLRYAERYFKVSKLGFSQDVRYYMLSSNGLKLFCIISSRETSIVGAFPPHYLKLLNRALRTTLL